MNKLKFLGHFEVNKTKAKTKNEITAKLPLNSTTINRKGYFRRKPN
jgi:hypothetical protein